MPRPAGCLLALFLAVPAAAREQAPPPRPKGSDTPPARPKDAMPLTGLSPARPQFDACTYRYPVGTTNDACQAFVDQGLGMYYSYVWMEAARAFETALRHDPDCAYAWLMLHRSLEKWGKGTAAPKPGGYAAVLGGAGLAALPDRVAKAPADYALGMARRLHPQASPREQLHIQSRLQERGLWPNTPPDARARKARESLDELLTLHEDDQEGWYWRAQLAEGTNGKTPFYKALLRLNPDHPGANHELVHFYENVKRPALGWPYAEGYIRSSPGIPHAFHMQAHLAMRIGKWGPTTDWSARAYDLQKQYHHHQGVKPDDDHQFSHHLETLTRSLLHDGRFAEARRARAEAEGYKYTYRPEWFKLAVATEDWDEAERLVGQFRRAGKADGAYYAALLWLDRGRPDRAAAEVEALRHALVSRKDDKAAERRLWEVQGRLLCQQGDGAAGLKLLKRAVDAMKNDYFHHSWGNGAVLMEAWGIGALEAGDAAQAEEAFQEALAHDAGSVRGALGLWAVCHRLGRHDEAERYLLVARRCWSRADPADFARQQQTFAAKAARIVPPTNAAVR